MSELLEFAKVKSVNAKRRAKVIAGCMDVSGLKVLEIGASDDPTFREGELDIYFMDWFSKEELFNKFEKTRPARAKNLIDVDYVVKENSFSEYIQERFDLIIANHVVEHIPDLLRWLAQARALLKPDGGLFLSIPHKDYTFDKIRRVSTLVDILECYDLELTAPSVYQVFEHIHLWRPIVAKDVWEGNYDHLLTQARFPVEESMRLAIQNTRNQPYVDVHCHVFTTESWRGLIDDLKSLGKMPFDDIETIDIQPGCNEFYSLMVAGSPMVSGLP